MHALIPLLLIFILFNRNQLKADKLYRANVFALVGISYFFLYQHTLYWYRIFPTDNALQFIPGTLIVSATVFLALSPWNKNSHPIKTALLCSLCAAALVLGLGFDRPVKEKLAEIGGYFEDGTIISSVPAADSRTLDIAAIGIQLDLSSDWQERKLDSGHTYFVLQKNGQLAAEIRPNCLGDFNVDTPTFVFNTLELFAGTNESAKCTRDQGIKECLIISGYATAKDVQEKWRWFKMQDKSWSMEIDVLAFTDDQAVKEEILTLLASARPAASGPSEPCRTPATWL